MMSCSDFVKPEKEGFLPSVCCISCHEDYDNHGYDLCTVYGRNNEVIGEVCCVISNIIDAEVSK